METEKAIERVKEIKAEYNKMDGLKEYVEAIETIMQEYRKQEKMIKLMANHFYHIIDNDDNASLFPYEVYLGYDNIEERVKQYFENKANEEAE